MVETLNIAQICPGSHVLGPGKRFVIWVQGCPFRCDGCVAPDWIPIRPNCVLPIDDLVDRIASVTDLEGITLSGGEPVLQAEGLATLIQRVRHERPELSTIAFSGFILKQLRRRARLEPGVNRFLNELDVLIDGLYRKDLNDDLGLRGSSNQRVHFLTPRYEKLKEQFEHQSRETELHILSRELLMVGVPSAKTLQTFESLTRISIQPKTMNNTPPITGNVRL